MPLFLGVDVGTQSTKVVVWDSDSGKICSSSSVAYGILPSDVEGRAEQEPMTWVKVRR
jgi:sugar (pentulose or hexulose) kinase